jgi:hypothetical protein
MEWALVTNEDGACRCNFFYKVRSKSDRLRNTYHMTMLIISRNTNSALFITTTTMSTTITADNNNGGSRRICVSSPVCFYFYFMFLFSFYSTNPGYAPPWTHSNGPQDHVVTSPPTPHHATPRHTVDNDHIAINTNTTDVDDYHIATSPRHKGPKRRQQRRLLATMTKRGSRCISVSSPRYVSIVFLILLF